MTALLGTDGAQAVAGLCGFTAVIISICQIISHIRNYTGPLFQRYIVRIVFMVPLYSIMSFLSLLMPTKSIYFDSVRDCYEAWMIYNFLSLCLAFVGGPGQVEVKMNGFTLMPSWLYWTCCLPPLQVNGQFVRMCKRGALQFVYLKPLLALLTVVLSTQDHYTDGYWGPDDGYLWITIIYNITYSLALYALLLFYLGAHDMLLPYNPLLKFALVKLVIFLTFWQGLFVAFLVGGGAIATVRDGKNLQNFLICVEMLPAALGMLFAFPYTEYKGAPGANAGIGLQNMRHVISIRDVVSDTVHQFAPTYHDYVLYDNAGKKAPPKTVRAKAFEPGAGEGPSKAKGNSKGKDKALPEAMESNLLANMEMGIHRPELERTTTDLEALDGPGTPVAGTGNQGRFVLDPNEDLDDDDAYLSGPQEEDEDDEVPHSSASIQTPIPHSKMLRNGDGSGDGARTSELGEASSAYVGEAGGSHGASTLTGRPGSGPYTYSDAMGLGPSGSGRKSPPRKGSRRGAHVSPPAPKLLSKWKPSHDSVE